SLLHGGVMVEPRTRGGGWSGYVVLLLSVGTGLALLLGRCDGTLLLTGRFPVVAAHAAGERDLLVAFLGHRGLDGRFLAHRARGAGPFLLVAFPALRRRFRHHAHAVEAKLHELLRRRIVAVDVGALVRARHSGGLALEVGDDEMVVHVPRGLVRAGRL